MPEKRAIIVNGYAYPNIDEKILEEWLSDLTNVFNFSYGVAADGSLIDLDDINLILSAASKGAGSVMVITPMNEAGQFSNEIAAEVLRNPKARARLTDDILNTLEAKDMSGVDFDFEYVQAADKDLYVSLVAETAERLNPFGYTVTAALAPKISADQEGLLYGGHDYAGMGRAADYTLLMTYEWGYTFGPPMAVAPINQVRRVLEYGISEIEPSKILMGIPNYGYDWTLPFVKGESKARKISVNEGFKLAEMYGVSVEYDEAAQAPYFYYTDENNQEHIVWFENKRSLAAKLALIDEYSLAGAAYWNIMTYYEGNEEVLNDMYDIL